MSTQALAAAGATLFIVGLWMGGKTADPYVVYGYMWKFFFFSCVTILPYTLYANFAFLRVKLLLLYKALHLIDKDGIKVKIKSEE